jgi:ATP-dependent Lon protease
MNDPLEPVALPSQLGVLHLVDQVLLPTALARVQVPSASTRGVALLEHLAGQHSRELYVAVLPALTAAGAALNLAAGDGDDDPASNNTTHKGVPSAVAAAEEAAAAGRVVATAARVLQLSRQVATGDFVVLLEGLCRVELLGPAADGGAEAPSSSFDVARIAQLELAPVINSSGSSSTAAAAATTSAAATAPEGADDPAVEALGGALREATRELLGRLSHQAGLPAVRRLLDLLERAPAWRSADVVAAALGAGPATRLAVLRAVDPRARVALAARLAAAALAAVQEQQQQQQRTPAAVAGTSAAPALSSSSSPRAPPPTRVPALPPPRGAKSDPLGSLLGGGGGGGLANEDDDDDGGLSTLLQRLAASRPPREVLKAAAKEARRLRAAGGEQQPGAGAARQYLEVLADLPWSRLSTDVPVAGGGNGASGRQHQRANAAAAAAAAAFDLAAARRELDAGHKGLERAKRRILEYLAVQALRGGQDGAPGAGADASTTSAPSPILCLIGPPGVGKTSLARSVARALRRPYQRVALGGVRDEAEIRGHRRTYVGATHGRVVAALRRARVADPLLLLDEVDKLGRDAVRGDPASALLELLDPEQNAAFVDHYLGLPLDCSRVVFFCTANRASDIPGPLLDRLEIIQLGGYTPSEKAAIAKEHLIPKLLREHGLRGVDAAGGEAGGGGIGAPPSVAFAEGVVERLIEGYTREAGVRGLSRALAAVCRHVAVGVVEQQQAEGSAASAKASAEQQQQQRRASPYPKDDAPVGPPYPPDLLLQQQPPAAPAPALAALAATAPAPAPAPAAGVILVDLPLLEKVLGPARHPPGGAEAEERVAGPGCAAGLVWTQVGGSVQFVEALRVSPSSSSLPTPTSTGGAPPSPSSSSREGRLTLTGQAGEVLGESARIALSWIRAHAGALGLDPRAVGGWDVHVHLPAGAVPKDGPSAGVTLAVALVSLFSGRAARSDTAMTGELTLRGLVLPVGGLKEKLLAARAAGLKRAIVPMRNLPDVEAEAKEATQGPGGLEIIGAARLEQVLAAAFDPPFLLVGGGAGEAAAPANNGARSGLGDGMLTTDVAAARRSML